MAPLPETILSFLPRRLLPREAATTTADLAGSPVSPLEVYNLHRRATSSFEHGDGARPASSFNNQGFLALFALIGAGMVIATIWFFFWAKNGGFKFKENDWDDYKSTVLRRKGPDGKTLSNASKSTRLGGGSVVHGGSYGREDLSSVGYTDSTGFTDKDEMRETGTGHGIRGGDARSHRSGGRKNRSKDPELSDYRNEKAARVGGMNRQHDGSYFDYSATEPSDVSRAPLMGSKEEKKQRAREEKEKKTSDKEKKQSDKANAKKAKEEARAAQKAEAAQKKKEAMEKKKLKSSTAGPTKPAAVVLAEPANQNRSAPSAAYSFVSGQDDNQTVYSGAYTVPYSDYSQTHSQANSESRSRSQARSQADSVPSQASYYDAYRPQNTARHSHSASQSNVRKPRLVQPSGEWQSQAGQSQPTESEIGTKSYPHYIPGLSSAPSVGVSESVSQVGGRRDRERRRERERRRREGRESGYRRGGRGRSDSLSDSE